MTGERSGTQKRIAGTSSSESDKDASLRMIASSSFILVIVVLGLPMWWKTTEVSRVPLPYDGINALSDVPIIVRSTVAVYAADEQRGALLIDELRAQFAVGDGAPDVMQVEFVRVALSDGGIEAARAKTPAELERLLLAVREIGAGDFLFMEWAKLRTEDVLVTAERTALMSTDVSSTKIAQVLRTWILEEHKLLSILASRPQTTTTTTSTTTTTPKPQSTRSRPYHTNSRHLIPHPDFDVVISVLNPDPMHQRVHWDVRAAAAAYLQPLFDAIAPLSRFTIKSQWLYQVSLDHPRRQVPEANSIRGHHYALDSHHLPHIITALEGKLGQPISDHPCLHLVVYAPACASAPLRIYDAQGVRTSHGADAVDSFLSPKWGAIVIANPGEKLCAEAEDQQRLDGVQKVDVHVPNAPVMQSLLYLVRRLLDIQSDVPITNAQLVPLATVRPRAFELDAFARSGCVHLVHSATLTLQSLVQLLDGIGNIVINEAVGRAVQDAFEHVTIAKRLLAEQRLPEAVVHARIAFDASERAFFDPSMLALLYFPDDQKFAIYIPLFLPILIPVLLSVIALWRYWWKRNERKKAAEVEGSDGHEKTE